MVRFGYHAKLSGCLQGVNPLGLVGVTLITRDIRSGRHTYCRCCIPLVAHTSSRITYAYRTCILYYTLHPQGLQVCPFALTKSIKYSFVSHWPVVASATVALATRGIWSWQACCSRLLLLMLPHSSVLVRGKTHDMINWRARR
jgi:hypothetical protein